MELNKYHAVILCALFLLTFLVSAATQKIYVDSVYNKTNIINVSNISIVGQFSDGVLVVAGGRITRAYSINVSNATGSYLNFSLIYENGNRVLTIASGYNTSQIEDLDFYNGSQVNSSVAAGNASLKAYVDAQDLIFNGSRKNYSLIENFPVACPGSSAVTDLSYPVTCTDAWVDAAGDTVYVLNISSNLRVNGSITLVNGSNSADIWHNGSGICIGSC